MKTADEIKQHLLTGDYAKIGKLVGVSPNYAIKLMGRTTSSKHKTVLDAARKVANANIKLGLTSTSTT